MKYSSAEKVDMVAAYMEAGKSAVRAKQLYGERFPDRCQPARNTFSNVFKQFSQTGNLSRKTPNRENTATNTANEINILAAVTINPSVSCRQLERESNISRSSVVRVLHRYKFHPYHVSKVQDLTDNDFYRRLEFCEWALCQSADFFKKVMFTDEATFTKNGYFNLKNTHFWSTQNPHCFRQIDHQHRWSLNVWIGIIDTHIIGPYFIDGSLNGTKHRHFIMEILPTLLEDVPLRVRLGMWMQQDGCSAHYSLTARDALNRQFPNRWMGRGGPINFPARSPDLTPLDFFLWGHLKNTVYAKAPTTVADMKQRIIAECRKISADTLNDVNQSLLDRFKKCRDVNGRYVEPFL